VDLDPSRLRWGEWIVAAGAVVLLASMFALDWFGSSSTLNPPVSSLGTPSTVNGWNGLTNLRWLMLVTIACGFLLVFFQAVRPSPAVPVTFSVIVTVFASVTALALIYRVLISQPSGYNAVEVGAYVGLVSPIVLVVGGYESMRQEGIASRDAPTEIETIRLTRAGRS
jgi:hypothetical protein